MSAHYQIIVIGAGPGGYIAALKAAQLGASVAVVERHHLGGTCLNYGCIPSKALLSSAELLHRVRHAATWGIRVNGQIDFDWPAIQKHKDKVVRQLRGGVGALLKGRKVTLLEGAAKFDGPGRVVVESKKGSAGSLTADHIIIATGSQPVRIPGWPTDPAIICTSDEAVHWPDLPRRLLIVGGGVIGCEFACMMAALGVQVTVVEMLAGLLPTLDADLGSALAKVFKDRGIACHVNTRVDDIHISGGAVTARLSTGDSIEVDRVLVSVGRSPVTQALNLASAGVETSRRGFVPVDDHLRTNVKGVWCIGDANGRCLLAHAASAHGVAAVENALGHARPFTAPIPSAVYTFPEIGSVGMTQADARAAGLPIAIGRFALGRLGKAMAAQHAEGMVKVIRHRESDAILGVHMIGHNATECIAAAGAMLHKNATTHELAELVFAHPTISEVIKESAEDALAAGLHLPPRKIIKVPAAIGA